MATLDSLNLIPAALAAWRAGCAYLPIDPGAPQERSRHMLTESEAQVIVTDSVGACEVPPGPWRHVYIDDLLDNHENAFPSNNPFGEDWKLRPADLAYVIYTSGSTGKPKGVAVTQGNLRHFVSWYHSAFDVTPEDRGTQFAALTFDAAVLEIWPLMAAGATLFVPDRSISLAPERLRDYLVAQNITLCFAPTAVAERLLPLEWPSELRLRFLLTGAEALYTFPRMGLPFQVVNNYGPTECTVLATSGVVPVERSEQGVPTIGKPISGTRVHLLGPDLRLVPDGACGQICIEGPGVARGYIGRPDLTAERFINVPWGGSSRLYLTGDLGRKLASGEFEFRGRLDDQINLRGYRIEPGEIEGALRSHSSVSAAAVVRVDSGANQQLAGYLVLSKDVSAAELRGHLLSRIPEYMIPAYFVRLDALPMTSHGKINRTALPLPDGSNSLEETDCTSELTTEIQVEVGSIISNLLGRELRPHDNFFRMGGHSLLAAQVIARIHSTFGIELALRSIFESPSVAALSNQIEKEIMARLLAAPSGELIGRDPL